LNENRDRSKIILAKTKRENREGFPFGVRGKKDEEHSAMIKKHSPRHFCRVAEGRLRGILETYGNKHMWRENKAVWGGLQEGELWLLSSIWKPPRSQD